MAENKDILQEYKKDLEARFDSKEFSVVTNSNRSHNAMIQSVMFEKCSHIRMYCGELSFLRKGFYSHIANDESQDRSDEAREVMTRAFREFIGKDGAEMVVYVENYSNSIFQDMIDRRMFIDAMRKGIVKLYAVDDRKILKQFINHIVTGDDKAMYRQETEKADHKADCFFYVEGRLHNNALKILDCLKAASYSIDPTQLPS